MAISFALELKSKRLNKHLTMRDVSDALANKYDVTISSSMISRYENGATVIPLINLWVLADFLQIDLNKIAYLEAKNKALEKSYDPNKFDGDYK